MYLSPFLELRSNSEGAAGSFWDPAHYFGSPVSNRHSLSDKIDSSQSEEDSISGGSTTINSPNPTPSKVVHSSSSNQSEVG